MGVNIFYSSQPRLYRYLSITIIIFTFLFSFLKFESFPGHEWLRIALIKSLGKVEADIPLKSLNNYTDNVIYILGGWQGSMGGRFKIASALYKKGISKRILILSTSGITEYNPSHKRNLTNDEWAILKLTELGVGKEDIEPVSLKEGFFGTLSEAKGISQYVSLRGFRKLIVITSPYHSRRVYTSFSKFLKKSGIDLYIYTSDEPVGLKDVLSEYIKLAVYNYLLLKIN